MSLYTLNSLRIRFGVADEKLHLVYNGVDVEFWDAGKVSEAKKREWRKKF